MKRGSTKEPALPFRLSRYEGPRVSMLYPTGWEIVEEPMGLLIAQSPTNFITIQWTQAVMNIEPTAEDRYRKNREIAQANARALREVYPQFEVLREYRLGDAPIFEYQYWDEKYDCLANEQVMSKIDPGACRWVIAGWKIWGASTSTAYWGWCLRSRCALFDTVMQSITFEKRESDDALPLSKYEGTWLSLLYPTGWTEIEEKPGMFTIWEPSYCSSILIGWAEFEFEVGKTSEGRYRERREATYRAILKNEGSLPQFEILHEYRLGEAPVFEYQYWDEDFAAVINMRTTRYIDVESRHFILVSWSLADVCGADKWHQEMDSRRALFDTVMQSITFR